MKTIILTVLAAVMLSFGANANPEGEKPKSSNKIASWVNKNIKYPSDAVELKEQGTVYVAITVKNGVIDEAEVVDGVSESLDNEVLNTIQTVPVAELGVDPDENKTYILPVKFVLK